jgi:hypothetical protein
MRHEAIPYKAQTNLRAFPSLVDFAALHVFISRPPIMQFVKFTTMVAFISLTSAAAVVGANTPKAQYCKPLFERCDSNAECCSNRCILNVSFFTIEPSFMDSPIPRCLSFVFKSTLRTYCGMSIRCSMVLHIALLSPR